MHTITSEVNDQYPDAVTFDHINDVDNLTNLEAFELGMLHLTERHGVPRQVQREINALINDKLLSKLDTTTTMQGK